MLKMMFFVLVFSSARYSQAKEEKIGLGMTDRLSLPEFGVEVF